MYKISEEQKNMVVKAMYDSNAPVKVYESIVVLLNSLEKDTTELPVKESKVINK